VEESCNVFIIFPCWPVSRSACPPSSQIFTIQLKNLNSPGVSLAISTDGTVQTVNVLGATYRRASGNRHPDLDHFGRRTRQFHGRHYGPPLTSWAVNPGLGVNTTHNEFAIAWAPGQAATVPALSPFAALLLAGSLCATAMYPMLKRMAGFDLHS
jgi:hypothetical protein